MNWNAVGAGGEIIGAIAVIASLIYVAQQINKRANQRPLHIMRLPMPPVFLWRMQNEPKVL